MEKQLIMKRGSNTLKGGSSNKEQMGVQAFSLEIVALLDVFARIELRRQQKQRTFKEVR